MTIRTVALRCLSLSALMLSSLMSSAQAFSITPGFGGSGGQSFYLVCRGNMVIVGIVGRSGTVIDRIDPVCTEVDANGNWSMSRRTHTNFPSRAGGTGGGPFELLCPTDRVVASIQGRSGALLDSLSLRCHRLTNGVVPPIVPRATRFVGGTGGSPFGPVTCAANEPAIGFSGTTTGGFIERIAVVCNKPEKFGGTPVARSRQEFSFGSAIAAGASRQAVTTIDGICDTTMTYGFDDSSPHARLLGEWMTAGMACVFPATGGRANVTALAGFTLKNGWKVDLFVPVLQECCNGEVTVTGPPAVGTDNPATTFHVWSDPGPPVLLSAKIIIDGPTGTNPYIVP